MQRKERITQIAGITAALIIAAILLQFPFYYIESTLYDARFRTSPSTPISDDIVTVRIGRNAIQSYQGEPDAIAHKIFLEQILKDNPYKVVYNMWPFSVPGEPENQKALADLMANDPRVIFIANELPIQGDESSVNLKPPYDKVRVIPGAISKDSNKYAADDVSRRILLFAEGKNLIHAELAQKFNGISDPKEYRGVFPAFSSFQGYVDFRPTGTYKPIEFANVLQTLYPSDAFTGKIVIVGLDTAGDRQQYTMTPYSRDITAMSTLEAHANYFDTLIQNTGVKKVPGWINVLVTLVIAVLASFVVFYMTPAQGVTILLMTLTGFCLISWGAFAFFRIWITMTHPILAVFITYYIFIPYRLIQEYSKRWEYQQKNKLLTQVEELKTNFLSMMSHDIKTPLARIQGMAELIQQNSKSLTTSQQDALTTINQSTEELSVFISSILNLGRIESKEVKLNLQGKDINSLVDEVIKKHQFLAKAKQIELIAEYEPLFSIKVDVDMIRQVFSNLIENAIKYSPEKSKVLISTEESNNRVIIQVADQGIGIERSDFENIFMKFYRSRDAKTSPIKGSGLGLYLAKYFVELHKGNIVVESVHQQGSTFTVSLPMEQSV